MTLRIGEHARQRMFERGISVDEVAEAIRKGTKWKDRTELHSAMGAIEVVYKVMNSDIFVITVYYR